MESDLWCACIHTTLLTGRRPEQETAEVGEHIGTQQTEALLLVLFYFLGPNFPIYYAGEGDNEKEEGGRKMERKEGNRVRHKEGSFEQAPGLSRGEGKSCIHGPPIC